jgi:hypothetical protein
MARTKSPYQIAREEAYEKRAIELYKEGNSLRKVEIALKLEGINKSYEWVRDVLVKHGITSQSKKDVV